uniref:Uncharacterized protein n=1 Tax=Candidatus Kentrum sp. LFY TaxID=2126342 RepID=A0A450WP50_9GAMM|nr:MAG: hypothetical protein BECKLFY1418C_GA0070996_104913 [Candidatus Kentron sp. LFY]
MMKTKNSSIVLFEIFRMRNHFTAYGFCFPAQLEIFWALYGNLWVVFLVWCRTTSAIRPGVMETGVMASIMAGVMGR